MSDTTTRLSGRAIAWALYDWAYSPFNTIVTTFVFATYFVRAVAPDPTTGAAMWAGAQATAGFVIAVLAVPMGAVADHGGYRHALLVALTLAMAALTAMLWTVRPSEAYVARALWLVGAATVAYELATTVYNAMLPEMVAPERMGRLSGLSWGFGYVGGLAGLAICLFVLIRPAVPPLGLDPALAEPVRAAPAMAALWMLAFAAPLMLWPRPRERAAAAPGGIVGAAFAGLRATWRTAAAEPALRTFLIARMLYGDGLITLFAFGGIYAAGTFGMDTQAVLLLGIALNVTAGIGALGFALVEDRVGDRRVVLVSLFALIVLGAAVLAAPSARWFWAAALPLGLFIGPAQSASRCLMARLAPEGQRASLFGLYALSGRVTGFVGPAALGAVTAATGSQRAGMSVVLVLLAAGAALLALGQNAKPARAARART